ncbi:hypothetical protein QBC39DRAFT_334019 [Podospora conica]|nr:hypothetical protein QBC39DRAFT_334019 [Schizothecium conicum]
MPSLQETLNSYYRDIAKEAGFKIPALRYKGASHQRSKLLINIILRLPPELADYSTRERSNYIRLPKQLSKTNPYTFKRVANNLNVVKEYADLKSILRAYLCYQEGGIGLTYGFYTEEDRLPATGLTSRYIVNIAARINRVTRYFEENDGGIYEPPFPAGRSEGSGLAKYEGRKPEYKAAKVQHNEDDKEKPP